MPTSPEIKTVLERHPKAIAHLRRQVANGRFGMVVGAGISSDFRVPCWSAFVDALANSPKVGGTEIVNGQAKNRSLPYKTELLFQRFRERELHSPDLANLGHLQRENSVIGRWMELCASILYLNEPPDLESAIRCHSFLEAAIPLIQRSSLTVNYNFDDYLERTLGLRKRQKDKGNRGFESVTDPWPQFRRVDCVIYHPHGIVPHAQMESPVDRFVFSESGYSKQYFGPRGHDSSFLIGHFARNTCLIVGCSLEEELRNVLMRGGHINPGNYHYYVQYVSDEGAAPNDEERKAIFNTNFNVYNLITLFATAPEIRALLTLINPEVTSSEELKDHCTNADVSLKFSYYMTGPLGVGKSTAASNLRSLVVLDEWLETRPSILAKPWDTLTATERVEVDNWISGQFAKKNDSLRQLNDKEVGVVSIVDRPPLDPLVFTPISDRPAKAKMLLGTICPGNRLKIEPGVVIILTGDPEELSARVRATGRTDYDACRLKKMQEDIIEVYGSMAGATVIDTRYLSVLEVTKQVAAIVHGASYLPCDLDQELKRHATT